MGRETIEVERQVTHTEEEELIICDSCGHEIEEDQDMVRYGKVNDVSNTPRVFLHEKPCAGTMDWVDPSEGPAVVGAEIRDVDKIISAHSVGSTFWGVFIGGLIGTILGTVGYMYASTQLTWLFTDIGVIVIPIVIAVLTTAAMILLTGRTEKKRLVKENF